MRNHFLQELKDLGIIEVSHVPGDGNDADMFTKNVPRAIFKKPIPKFVGKDEYMVEKHVAWVSVA